MTNTSVADFRIVRNDRGVPSPRPINVAGIPAALRSIPQWLCWKYGSKPNKSGKYPKIPINPWTGKPADATNRSHAATFDQAMHMAKRHGYGVGLMLTPDLNLSVVDQDGCIGENDSLAPFAAGVVERLDSFTEISDSGRGLHTFVYGLVPSTVRTKEIEIYFTDRYIAMTGDRWPGTPAQIMNRADAIAELHAEHADPVVEVERQEAKPVDLADEPLLKRMFASRNGQRLQALWAGDWESLINEKGKALYPSQSEADIALCGALAFWTGRDPVRMDRLFRQSGLYRPQWEKAAYRTATIDQAIDGCKQVYSGRGDSGLNEVVTFDGTTADILRYARQVVMDRNFAGRRAEYHRQAALGAIALMEKAGDLGVPISERTLAVVAGMSRKPARVSLTGLRDPKTGIVTISDDTLTQWLIHPDPVAESNGVFATFYALHFSILDEYSKKMGSVVVPEIARNESHIGVTRRVPQCGSTFAVSHDADNQPQRQRPGARLFVENMTDDAFARTKAPKAPIQPQPLDLSKDSHVDVLNRFNNLAGRLVFHCAGAWHTTAELADLCTMPHADPLDPADIANAFSRLFKIFHLLGTKSIFINRDGKFTLVDGYMDRLANLRTKLERLAQIDWIASVQVKESAKLKPFTPVGLAIIAFLDAQPTRSASISELAEYCDKHPQTIATTVYRMTTSVQRRKVGKADPETGERQALAPVLLLDRGADKRETIVTLPADWRQRVSQARPHLATDGVNQRRNKFYARERLSRLQKIRDITKNQDLINEIDRITKGAESVLAWGETPKMIDLHMEIDKIDAKISVQPTPAATVMATPAPLVAPKSPAQTAFALDHGVGKKQHWQYERTPRLDRRQSSLAVLL